MTFPAMQRIASEATPVARRCVSSRVVYAVSSLVLHGGFSHSQSSSSQYSTSAALSVQRASSATTARAAHSFKCVSLRSMHALSQAPNRGFKRGRHESFESAVGSALVVSSGWAIGRAGQSCKGVPDIPGCSAPLLGATPGEKDDIAHAGRASRFSCEPSQRLPGRQRGQARNASEIHPRF